MMSATSDSDDFTSSESPAPRPDDGAIVQRVRSRVLRQIAAESLAHHTFVHENVDSWHAFMPGIQRKVLLEREGVMSYLLKFDAGAVLPAHRHSMDEECVVIEGVLRVGEQQLPAGSFHAVSMGLLDCESSSDDGCVIYLRGASPHLSQLI